jgi:hypothetical protein
MNKLQVGDVVRVSALDQHNGKLGVLIPAPRFAPPVPEDWVWVELKADHPKAISHRVAYAIADLVAPKSLNR